MNIKTFCCFLSLSPAPPLTVDNVMKAVEGVKHWRGLTGSLVGYGNSLSLKDAVEQFLRGGEYFKPSWRAVIFALDMAGKTHLANRIWSYGEPVQGRCTYIHTHLCRSTHHATACVHSQ